LYAPPISHIPLNNKIVYSDYKSTGLSRYVQLQQAFYLHCNKYVKCLVDLPAWFNRLNTNIGDTRGKIAILLEARRRFDVNCLLPQCFRSLEEKALL
jgi:hypothetical protein